MLKEIVEIDFKVVIATGLEGHSVIMLWQRL